MSETILLDGSPPTKVERSYYPTGAIMEETTYVDDALHGFRRTWYENGQLSSEKHYSHDLEDGTSKRWNNKGELIGSYSMKKGTGTVYEWLPNGQVWLKADYVDGEFSGRVRMYYENGKLQSEKFYINGNPVSRKRYISASAKDSNLPQYEDVTQSPRNLKRHPLKKVADSEVDELFKKMLELFDRRLAGEAVYLDRIKVIRDIERWQLKSSKADAPGLYQFWEQSHGVGLIFIEGDALQQVPTHVRDRDHVIFSDIISEDPLEYKTIDYPEGRPIGKQKLGKMTAFPAHLGTLLSRRRKGDFSGTLAAWYSEGWTKAFSNSVNFGDEKQVGFMARDLARRVVAVCYGDNGGRLIEAAADGAITKTTSLDSLVKPVKDAGSLDELVKDQAHAGINKALRKAGIEIEKHVLANVEMLTILNQYDF